MFFTLYVPVQCEILGALFSSRFFPHIKKGMEAPHPYLSAVKPKSHSVINRSLTPFLYPVVGGYLMQLDTKWTGLAPVKTNTFERTDAFLREVCPTQHKHTVATINFLYQDAEMQKRMTISGAFKDVHLPRFLSSLILTGFLKSDKIYEDTHPNQWNEITVKWLNHTYEAILLILMIKPDSSIATITKALLNNTVQENWQAAKLCENGEIHFLDTSSFKLETSNGFPKASIKNPSPFVYEVALKEAIRKLLCTSRIAYRMQQCVEQKGFYLADKQNAIIDIIQAIHRSNSQALHTTEQIMAFDFQACVMDFILTKRAWLIEQ